jgi:hypothetical protein
MLLQGSHQINPTGSYAMLLHMNESHLLKEVGANKMYDLLNIDT